jgi:adenosine deaminase
MNLKRRTLALTLAVALSASAAHARAPQPSVRANEAATARHLASLSAGAEPQLAELTMFFSRMPKGGDLHHHYSGALYAEQYLDFLDRQGYCVNKLSYRIETDKSVVETEHAKTPSQRVCLKGSEVLADDQTYRELLQRWSSKDFYNHGALQPPPDRQFFQTFGFFGPVANANYSEGLLTLKQRAIEENVLYIETMFTKAPSQSNAPFDAATRQAVADDPALDALLAEWTAVLEQDNAFNQSIVDYVGKLSAAASQVDDANFTMRYQTYVVRLTPPSLVFSSMLAAFKSTRQTPLIVGVNIVGQESAPVSMRDYTLHMKMFRFLKTRYPDVKLALHAGELALGDVPPEGLGFHIDQAVRVAGANRIGHGIDLAHETNAIGILQQMRANDIPVEINLTSNDFIEGVRGQNHPVTLYRKYGVPMVIATDDAGVTRHNLANEYMLFASRYKPTYAEIKRLSYNSLRYAFLQSVEKQRLMTQLDRRYVQFEADIAALHTVQPPGPVHLRPAAR